MVQRIRRAPTACSWCHRRKVRCDALIFGSPCTRCRQDGRRECVLRAKNPKPTLSSADQVPPIRQPPDSNDATGNRHNLGQLGSHHSVTSRPRTQIGSWDRLASSTLSHLANVLYTEYLFVDSQQLQDLPSEDLTFLESKDCLSLPGPDAIDEFIRKYFRCIHPIVPILDEVEVWRIYRDNQSAGPKISLFVLQALLFASCTLVSVETLRQCGFKDQRDAGNQLYTRAKMLFEFKTERQFHANAQGAILLTHYASGQDPQAGSFWLRRAIQQARLIDAESSVTQENVSVSLKKRLWWSILLRDRSLSIGLRRRPQITSINFHGWSDHLSAEDFYKELRQSPVYDYNTKTRLLATLQNQCQLAVVVTDLVSLIFNLRRTARRYLSMIEYQALLARMKNITKSLDEWKQSSHPLVPPTDTSRSEGADVIARLMYMTYMFYYAARMSLAQYAAFVLEENMFYAGDTYNTLLLDISNDLRESIDGLSLVMEHFSVNAYTDGLPLSVLVYLSMPLVLAAIDFKLSPSRKEMEIRQKRLNSLSQIVRHSEALYDVTDCVAINTNHVLQLAYKTTQNLFLNRKRPRSLFPESPVGDTALSSTQPQAHTPDGSISFKFDQPTNWQDAFIQCPRAYLLISTSVDYNLSIGRLPSASCIPDIIRDLPCIGAIGRLPWTSEIVSFDYGNGFLHEAQQPNYPTSGRYFSDNSSNSVDVITIESDSEQSHSQQQDDPLPEPFPEYSTIPPLTVGDQLRNMNTITENQFQDTAPNLDFMDFEHSQNIPNHVTESLTFTIPLGLTGLGSQTEIPLEQTVFEDYDASTTLASPTPQASKAIDSLLFDTFFQEGFEQGWIVS
ncbi:hypothetical protein N7457_002864 [Penicillium paradoxum]|uniref:uncharacterized protein n=1 Tax=Penicillium paradoxum TaxID=176176 RepID=UPI00254776DF|nr:uncharacterized protein N7457_002864 [Penicillium paradoxum]KAJ5787874.1 hypothetical protein N7457_002864 [Penicillium paradoxum]